MSLSTADGSQDGILLRTHCAGVATLTLNRPQQMNALSMDLLDALQSALNDVAADPAIRVVVIAANGKAFCPGHDLKEMLANRTRAFIGSLFDKCCDVMMSITRMPQPVIARVHGIATAAGCQLVGACDLAVASPAQLDRAVSEVCALLLSKPSVVLAAGKKFFYRQIEMDMASAYSLRAESSPTTCSVSSRSKA